MREGGNYAHRHFLSLFISFYVKIVVSLSIISTGEQKRLISNLFDFFRKKTHFTFCVIRLYKPVDLNLYLVFLVANLISSGNDREIVFAF